MQCIPQTIITETAQLLTLAITSYPLQVSPLWKAGHHQEARFASTKSKKLAVAALVSAGISAVLFLIISLACILTALGVLGYLSNMIYV